MYVKDGTKNDYPFERKPSKRYFAWGWLSSEHSYRRGLDPLLKKVVLQKLKSFDVTDLYRGSHRDEGLGLTSERCRELDIRANGSIKFVHDGIIYTAPAAVIYYIEHLDYCPHMQVVEALLEI